MKFFFSLCGYSCYWQLIYRFGDLKLKNPDSRAFAQAFQKNYAGKVMECHLNLLNVIRAGGYLPDRVTNLILQYLSNRWFNFSFPLPIPNSVSMRAIFLLILWFFNFFGGRIISWWFLSVYSQLAELKWHFVTDVHLYNNREMTLLLVVSHCLRIFLIEVLAFLPKFGWKLVDEYYYLK